MTGFYIYGIVSTARPLTLSGHGLAGGLRVIAEGAAGAVAGGAPNCDWAAMPRQQAVSFLLRHQDVLDEVMAQTTVLPVKFGTVAPDEDAIRHMLIQGSSTLSSCLAELDDHLQMEVAVLWRLDQVFAEIASGHDIARLREKTLASEDVEDSARLERAVKIALERRRAALTDEVCDVLGTVATGMAMTPLPDDRMAANVALLLNKTDIGSLEGILNRLHAEMAGEVRFRATGPLPPASFATVEITFPPPGAADWLADASAVADMVMVNIVRQQMLACCDQQASQQVRNACPIARNEQVQSPPCCASRQENAA